jgi:kumamolisin
MTDRSRFVFALSSLFALAACQGGAGGLSGGNVLPTGGSPSSKSAATAQRFTLLSEAPRGIRTYVHLPLRNGDQLDRLIREQSSKNSPMFHHFLTVAQFRAAYGPRTTDLQRTAQALTADGFKTTVTSQGVVADAPQATVERVFRVHLRHTKSAMLTGFPLVADRAPTVPSALTRVGAQVAAYAPIRPLQPQIAMASKAPIKPQNRYGPNEPFYWFDDLKQAYTYPSYTVANGKGRTTALIAASNFLDSDLGLYLGSELLAPPTVVRRNVDGGPPPFESNNPNSQEVSLDVQQQAGSAPGASIMVYGAPDASVTPSFVDIFTAIDEDNAADVVGNSFGGCELFFLSSYHDGESFTYLLQLFHDLFRQGNAQGITFVEGSGDNGAQGAECTDPTFENATVGVEAFADDPNVTGVGGTNLQTSSIPGSLQSTYVGENANFDTFLPGFGFANGAVWGSGGGKSVVWPKPFYQYFVNSGAFTRAVPDVSMMMGGCPLDAEAPCGANPLPTRSAFVVAVDGQLLLFIGTSGSNQEFAGLQAVQDEALGGRAGNVNYLLYALAAIGGFGPFPIFHDNIPGNNGGYASHQGYNFVVGNGTPYGSRYALLPFVPVAGNPQTPSNP